MPLQSSNLVMLALPSRGDVPPPGSGQPPLRDGIHLRWQPLPKNGFPWYGFYLYRRRHPGSEPRCLFSSLSANNGITPGDTGSTSATTNVGKIASEPLTVRFSNLFPGAACEVALPRKNTVRWEGQPGEVSFEVLVKVGFPQGGGGGKVRVQAWFEVEPGHDAVVAADIVSGNAGDVVAVTLTADAINAITCALWRARRTLYSSMSAWPVSTLRVFLTAGNHCKTARRRSHCRSCIPTILQAATPRPT